MSGQRGPLPAPPSPGQAALRAHGISVLRGDRLLLDRVSLDAVAGEVHVLIGPNGAGKSTLLAACSGDQEVSAGSIQVSGRPLREWRLAELARRRAVLPQHGSVFFPFTVREVVGMGRNPWAGTTMERDDDAEVARSIGLTELEAFTARTVPSLSGGERARTGFARVLAQRTGTLLLDEPTAAMDIRHQELLLSTLRRCAADGCAVVVVLHDLAAAMAFGDRVTLLDGGRVAAQGTPGEVMTADRLSRVYGHEIEIVRHPLTGMAIVVPTRTVPARHHPVRETAP